MARGARRRRRARRPERAQLPARARRRPRPGRRRRARAGGHDAVRQHDPAAARAAVPGRPRRSSGACARSCAGTRSRRCCRPTRSPRSSAATSPATSRPPTLYEVGFNHFWHAPSRRATAATSSTSRATRSPGVYARAFLEGRLSEEQLRGFRQEVSRRRALLLPAPVADAGLLAVPDGLDGPRPDHGDLPGPLHEVPAGPRTWPTPPGARCGRSWATARWTSRSRWARSRWPAASASTT